MTGPGDLPTIDVHAHVLLPGVDEEVAGQPGLLAARELDARRNGAQALAVSGAMVFDAIRGGNAADLLSPRKELS